MPVNQPMRPATGDVDSQKSLHALKPVPSLRLGAYSREVDAWFRCDPLRLFGSCEEIMNELTIRTSGVASTVKDPEMRVPMRLRCLVLCAVLVFANLPAVAVAQSPCPGIHVKILNIRNSTGTIACGLFESPAGFPIEYLRYATNIMVIKIRDTQARCDFLDIPPGTYALAVIHDENMNGKLDTNWLGVPTEGYGFSNDAKAVLSAPSFSAASFPYHGENLELTINLHY
jgi:uncharacterized protein (DUF2141 family)